MKRTTEERANAIRAEISALKRRALDADVRCSQWLADGNQARERDAKRTAERCYDKSQYWLDRRTALEDRALVLTMKLNQLHKM